MNHQHPLVKCIPLVLVLHLLPRAAADPSDTQCLTQLMKSIQDPLNKLINWTTPHFSNPCNASDSFLHGATCNNNRIFKLSLSNLSLKGTLSPFLNNCTNLQSLDLSSNSLSGPIPQEFYLPNIALLNLSFNELSGPIPTHLASCAYLNVIDLHQNQLTGLIPQQLGSLPRLSVFDVSNNELSGWIPVSLGYRSGGLVRFNSSSFEGNRELFGYPLGPIKNKGLSVMMIVGIGLGSGFLSLVLSFTAVCFWLKATEQKMEAGNQQLKIAQLMPNY